MINSLNLLSSLNLKFMDSEHPFIRYLVDTNLANK